MNADEWREIHALGSVGVPIKTIAQRLSMSRNTVRRALTLDVPPTDRRSIRSPTDDSVDTSIREVLAAAPELGVSEIGRRIGWEGSRTTLTRRVDAARRRPAEQDDPSPVAEPTATLPNYATPFVGRDSELRALQLLIGTERLITINGPGGMGKTRLAVHAASKFRRAFADGVRVVELASLHMPELLPQAVADALGLSNRGLQSTPTEQTLVDHLGTRRILLVLDNCEHLLDATARLISVLLRGTTQLHIIATSREVLGIPEEHQLALQPMHTHGSTDRLSSPGAVELFESRASAVLPSFEVTSANRDAVERVCAQLDGMPLAIELACSRLSVLSIDQLAARLDHRLDLLTQGNRTGPTRHRSLQATMDWSYELCTREQQLLWARTSVFVGGFDLEMAEQVCVGDGISSHGILDGVFALVAKSILQRVEDDGNVRFRMLETLREFGSAQLSAAETDSLRDRHFTWCADVLRRAADSWFGPDQRVTSSCIRDNRADIRMSLERALRSPDSEQAERAAGLIADVWFLWACGISVPEHRLWLDRVLAQPEFASVRNRASATAGLVMTLQGDRDAADSVLRSAIESEPDEYSVVRAFSTHVLGLNEFFDGRFDSATRLLTDSLELYRHIPERVDLLCTMKIHLGMVYSFTGDLDNAHEVFDAVRVLAEANGEMWLRSYAVYGLGLVALVSERYSEAARLAVSALELHRNFDDVVGTTLMTDLLAWAEAESGSADRAAVLLGAASAMWGSFGEQLYGSGHWIDKRQVFEQSARSALGPIEFEAHRASGSAMSVGELTRYALGEANSATSADDTPAVALSPRENEVAEMLVDGMSNKEIAARLVLSPRTIEGHVERVLQKLGMTRRQEVCAYLQKTGRPARL